MPHASADLDGSGERKWTGPDLFGFYLREIVDLLTQDEEFPPFPSKTEEAVKISSRVPENVQGTVNSSRVSSLFSNSLGDAIPDVRKELLNASMRQSVRALTQEVAEMIDPVMRVRQILSCIRSKKQHYEGEVILDRDSPSPPCKKQKTSSSTGERDLFAVQNGDPEEETEVDEHLKFLLENEDTVQLEETITKHSDELDVTLTNMEQKLEELLGAVVSKCRLVTRQEKQQLGMLIQKLPPKNLDRIVEIINRGKSSDSHSSDDILIDLEEQENVTLWRLYFYVKAVENARKLSA